MPAALAIAAALLFVERSAASNGAPAPPDATKAVAAGTVLQVRGVVKEPLSLTSDDLAKLARRSVKARDHNGPEAVYEGVPLGALLERAGVPMGNALRGEALQLYVLVEASDGYRAVFALPELDPACTDRVVLLADRREGVPIVPPQGPFRVVVPDEKRHARWVRGVTAITVQKASGGDAQAPRP
jgi:DMSO/TMAO reductase YedYZ molybdopterin-dependent catalytic subunit